MIKFIIVLIPVGFLIYGLFIIGKTIFDWEYRQEMLTNPKYSCGKWGNFLLKKCTFFYPPYLKSIRSNSKLKLSDDLYVMEFKGNKFEPYYCIVDKAREDSL